MSSQRLIRPLAAVLLGLLGGWIGLALGGTVAHEVGPLTTSARAPHLGRRHHPRAARLRRHPARRAGRRLGPDQPARAGGPGPGNHDGRSRAGADDRGIAGPRTSLIWLKL